MTRVELRIAGTVEHYDDDGRLLEALAVQSLTISALAADALAASIAALAGQLTAAAWPGPAAEAVPDGG